MLIKLVILLRKVSTENLKFRTDLRDRVTECWSVTVLHSRWLFTKVDCSKYLQNRSIWRKIEVCPVNDGLHMAFKIEACSINVGLYIAFRHHISFATDFAANFGCYGFRIMPEIVSKLLFTTIWSHCAVQFKSEQTPFSWTGRQFRSAALHRIIFGKCCFVPKSYFYSETNEWSNIERGTGSGFGW